MRAAIDDGALVNVNDQDELERLAELVPAHKSPLEIGLRISSTLPQLGTVASDSHWNGEATAALETIRQSPRLRLTALHTHLYGDTDDPQLYREAARRMGEFARDVSPMTSTRFGFWTWAVAFLHTARNRRAAPLGIHGRSVTIIESISDSLRPFVDATHRPTLVVEPGRYLTCDGILLVTRVVHVKERDGIQMVNCDGSISMVPLTHYCPQVIRAYTSDWQPRVGDETTTIIHGSTCRENDMLYHGMFPATKQGDYLVHFAAGAYNSSLSPDFIFRIPVAGAVLIWRDT